MSVNYKLIITGKNLHDFIWGFQRGEWARQFFPCFLCCLQLFTANSFHLMFRRLFLNRIYSVDRFLVRLDLRYQILGALEQHLIWNRANVTFFVENYRDGFLKLRFDLVFYCSLQWVNNPSEWDRAGKIWSENFWNYYFPIYPNQRDAAFLGNFNHLDFGK